MFGTQKRLLSIRINELSIVKFFWRNFFFDFENFFLFLVERDRFFTLMDYSEPIRGSFVVLRKHLSLSSLKRGAFVIIIGARKGPRKPPSLS